MTLGKAHLITKSAHSNSLGGAVPAGELESYQFLANA
jgi:hypothetical protein